MSRKHAVIRLSSTSVYRSNPWLAWLRDLIQKSLKSVEIPLQRMLLDLTLHYINMGVSTRRVPPSLYPHTAELQMSCFIDAGCEIGLPLTTAGAPKSMRRGKGKFMAPSLLPSQPSESSECMLVCAFPQPFKTYGTQLCAKSWNSRVELIASHAIFFSLFLLQNSNTKVKQEPLAGVEQNLLSRRRQEEGKNWARLSFSSEVLI